jgi:hypothetical protein
MDYNGEEISDQEWSVADMEDFRDHLIDDDISDTDDEYQDDDHWPLTAVPSAATRYRKARKSR